jgi:hypothetical protein
MEQSFHGTVDGEQIYCVQFHAQLHAKIAGAGARPLVHCKEALMSLLKFDKTLADAWSFVVRDCCVRVV